MKMAECESDEPRDPLAEDEASNTSVDSDSSGSLDSDGDCTNSSSDSSSECSDIEDDLLNIKSDRESSWKSKTSYEWESSGRVPKLFSERILSEPHASGTIEDEISSDPLEIFSNFFTDSFIRLGVQLTNENGAKFGRQLSVTDSELRAFIGMIIIMGFHRLPSVRLYWNYNANFNVPRISELMSTKRFLTLLKFVCFYCEDQSNKHREKDIFKIQPLLEHLNEKFWDCGKYSQWYTVDKSSVRMRGSKGVSITAMCCPKTGYLYRVHVSNDDRPAPNDAVVKDLISPLKGRRVSVVFNRRFTSFPLVEELYAKKIFSCSEIRQIDPNIPNALRNMSLKFGKWDFLQSGDVSITKWRQKRNVYILSTMHDASKNKPSFTPNKRYKPQEAPLAVADYYKHRRGVTICDSLRSNYSSLIRSRDWTTRFMFFMLDSAIANSYIIYKSSWKTDETHNSEQPLSMIQFRSLLADQLTKGFTGRKRTATGHLVKSQQRMKDVGSHMPEKSSRRRCAYCSTKQLQRRSTIACSECNVALCLPCFVPFHC